MTSTAPWIRQAAAIPVRSEEVCLVTSSSGRRWVIPKGLIDPGKTAGETALQEAWEEAGLVGSLHPEPMGSYIYAKYGGTCHVTVFLMQVTEEAENWPERAIRLRSWCSPAQAACMIEDVGLRELIAAYPGAGKQLLLGTRD